MTDLMYDYRGEPEDIVSTQPEWMSWPLEKLQQEYRKLKLDGLVIDMRVADAEVKFQTVQNFIDAMKAVQELGEDDD